MSAMSEVVPLPSFGEVFFDARGQERCLRVTWHEGTLVLSLWRGEMCTASFRMPMEDVGRLLDTLDEGFAEAAGDQPAVSSGPDPGIEAIPGTGTYHRPPTSPPQAPPLPDERPTAALSPNDVLVARGTPPQDKLVASYSEPPREPAAPQRQPFAGPQYTDPGGGPFTGPQYTDSGYDGPLSGPHYVQQSPGAPFSGPQYAEEQAASTGEPVYQMPGDRRRPGPLTTDPLGFPSQGSDAYQAADPYQSPDPYPPADPYQARQPEPYPQRQPDSYGGADSYRGSDSYGGAGSSTGSDSYGGHYQQQPPDNRQAAPVQAVPGQVPAGSSTAGLGTPMHGIPGAGRRHDPFRDQGQAAYGQDPGYGQDPAYGQSQQSYGQDRYGAPDGLTPADPPNPVDSLIALGQPSEPYRQPDSDLSRPYVGDPLFSTGERLRPEQQYDRDERREW